MNTPTSSGDKPQATPLLPMTGASSESVFDLPYAPADDPPADQTDKRSSRPAILRRRESPDTPLQPPPASRTGDPTSMDDVWTRGPRNEDGDGQTLDGSAVRPVLPPNFSAPQPSTPSDPTMPVTPRAPTPPAGPGSLDQPDASGERVPAPLPAPLAAGNLVTFIEDGDALNGPESNLPPMVAKGSWDEAEDAPTSPASVSASAGPTAETGSDQTDGEVAFSFERGAKRRSRTTKPSRSPFRRTDPADSDPGPIRPIGPAAALAFSPDPATPTRPSGPTRHASTQRHSPGPNLASPTSTRAPASPPPKPAAPAAASVTTSSSPATGGSPANNWPGSPSLTPMASPPPHGAPNHAVSVATEAGSRLGDGIIVATAAAIVAGLAWWAVVASTQIQFGYLVWGLGFLVGQAALVGARRGSVALGAVTGGLTVISLSAAQYFISRSLAISEQGLDVPLWNGFSTAVDVIRETYSADPITALFVLAAAAVAAFQAGRPGRRALGPLGAPRQISHRSPAL